MKLSEKDIRAIKLGVIATAAIVLFVVGSKWWDHWKQARTEGETLRVKLNDIDMTESQRKGLMAKVPAFEMPAEEEEQQFRFRDEFNEQLKKAGIKNDPLKIIANKRSPVSGYKALHLSCTAKCRFSQVLDLLAKLNENPYLVGIEEFTIKVDPKKRAEVELNITVSTFTKNPSRASRS